jgi:transcriptional regulator with XRE-family HTH domain
VFKGVNAMKSEICCIRDIPKFRERIEQLRGNTTQEEFCKGIGINKRTYQYWLNGEYTDYNNTNKYKLPDIETAMRICDKYKVSLDYLFGRIDCETVTNQTIKDMIGLNDTVINNLHCENIQAKKDGISREHCIDTVNFLLADKQGSELLTTIYHYLFGNYKELSNGDNILELRDGSGVPCNGGTVQVSSLNALFLSNIINNLAEIKADISKINGYDTYGKFDIKKVSDANQQKRAEILSDIPSFI